jgi:hypothetical protein
MGLFPHGQLAIGSRAFAHDLFNVRNLGLIAELLYLEGNELQHLAASAIVFSRGTTDS